MDKIAGSYPEDCRFEPCLRNHFRNANFSSRLLRTKVRVPWDRIMKYKTEKEIKELVRKFEDATVSREEWKHAEHLIVALYYASHHDLETAYAKMKSGIFKLLGAFGVDLTKEMPYHETLMVFWMRTVFAFSLMKNGASLMEKAKELVEKYDKDYPMRFYDREVLFSEKARAEFVEPGLSVECGL